MGITQFIDDDKEAWASPDYVPRLPRIRLKQALMPKQDVIDFLSRPIEIATGTYGITTPQNSVMFADDITTSLSSALWKDKWRGNLLMRGTAVFKFMINAMPFQAGLIMLKALPGDQSPHMLTMRTKTAIQMSQLPGVMMTLRQTSMEIEVPYRAPPEYHELGKTNYWGRIMVFAVMSMRTATTSTSSCDWSLWQSWKDVELEVPTLPQSGGDGATKTRKGVRLLRKKNVESEKNEGSGPLALILGGGAQIASGLGKFPILSSIMAPTQWFLNRAAGVASSFGWSKPVVSAAPLRVSQNPHVYALTADGDDVCTPLALTVDSGLKVIDTMGYTNIDEMSIAYLVSRWSFLSENLLNVWADVLPKGTRLLGMDVHPGMIASTRTDTTTSGPIVYANLTPMAFIAQLFSFWRGSIKIRFTMAKTEYHSGRLLLVYAPGATGTLPSATSDWCMREVIDVREGECFEFTLPYGRADTWLPYGTAMGRMELSVLNTLKAAPSVSSGVDYVLEVAGGPDLEFAVPRRSNMMPYLPQMDDGSTPSGLMAKGAIADAYIESVDDRCQETIGEGVDSLKQLALRHYRIWFVLSAAGLPTKDNGAIQPYYLGCATSTLATQPISGGAILGDTLSLVCSLYAFWRGSVRYRFAADPNTGTYYVWLSSPSHIAHGAGIGTNMASGGLGTLTQYTTMIAGLTPIASGGYSHGAGWQVHVPAYQGNRMRFVSLNYGPNQVMSDGSTASLSLGWRSTVGQAAEAILTRAGGDDYQCGLFLCVPPMIQSINGW